MDYWKGNTMSVAHFNKNERSIEEVLFEDDIRAGIATAKQGR